MARRKHEKMWLTKLTEKLTDLDTAKRMLEKGKSNFHIQDMVKGYSDAANDMISHYGMLPFRKEVYDHYSTAIKERAVKDYTDKAPKIPDKWYAAWASAMLRDDILQALGLKPKS